MAKEYKSKFGGGKIDALLNHLDEGLSQGKDLSTNDYTTEDKSLVEGIPNKANKKGYYPDMSVGMADKVKGVNEVQEKLSLTTKPNGNIVIGNLAGQSKEFMPATPSGDALHNWFSSIGGIYNPDTNLWSLLGVENMTSTDMFEVAKLGTNRIYPTADLAEYSSLARVVVGKKNSLLNTSSKALKMSNILANNSQVEVVQLSTYDMYSNYDYPIYTTSMGYAFYACSKLRIVRNKIDVSGVPSFAGSFAQCQALEILQLQGLKANISFAQSPLLSKESLLYMIKNCASSATFTITLHPDVYNLAKDFENGWGSEVEAAIDTADGDKNTHITLASA